MYSALTVRQSSNTSFNDKSVSNKIFLDTLFLYHLQTRPRKSVVICEIISKFAVSQGVMLSALHIDESVFAFILDKKSDSFKQRRGYDNTHFLYSYVAMSFLAYTPYYPSVGSCNRLFVLGFVRTSYQINGSQLHTFFLYITHYIGVV